MTHATDTTVNALVGIAYSYAVELNEASIRADYDELEHIARQITERLKANLHAALEVHQAAAPNIELGALQAEIAGHEVANLHLSAMVDELRELLQNAKRAMTELHQAAIPDESVEGVPAIIPPEAFAKFVDAHAQLCFLMHQRGHNPPKEGQRHG